MKRFVNYWTMRAASSVFILVYLVTGQGQGLDGLGLGCKVLFLCLMAPTFAWLWYLEGKRSGKSLLQEIKGESTPWILTVYFFVQLFVSSIGQLALSSLFGQMTPELYPLFYKTVQMRSGVALVCALVIIAAVTLIFIKRYRSSLKARDLEALIALTAFTALITFGITGSFRIL